MSKNLARIYSAELEGIDARLVEVEIDINVGISAFTIVGLADKSVNEARERVSSALKNIGIKPPTRENRRITVNLAPADVKKNGSQYDVPIALGYLVASNQISPFDTSRKIFVGELGLDGKIRSVQGILNICRMAKDKNFKEVYIPYANRDEASLIDGITIYPVKSFEELILHLEDKKRLVAISNLELNDLEDKPKIDFSDIKGQKAAKRAIIIAAAGGHNIFMTGTPGAGKTMLANSLISILPKMDINEAIEVMKIWSAAGEPRKKSEFFVRPFRAPHHSASLVSIVGGGQNPKPGEISLAHNGVLFLDEIPEFNRNVLESLRQPLENRYVIVSRAKKTLLFPANIMLVAASNPCPCGFFGDEEKECKCTPGEISRYQKKISGPLMDRLDIQVWVERVKSKDFNNDATEDTHDIKEKIEVIRKKQEDRYKELGLPIKTNSELSSKNIQKFIRIENDAKSILEKALDSAMISARGFFKIIKVAQTIADLEESNSIKKEHILEALSYRIKQDTL